VSLPKNGALRRAWHQGAWVGTSGPLVRLADRTPNSGSRRHQSQKL